MENIDKQLENLSGIRELMEKSSQFLSLSGLSGVFAGIFALLGAGTVYFKYTLFFNIRYLDNLSFGRDQMMQGKSLEEFIVFTTVTGIIILLLAISSAIFFSYRKAKKTGNSLWGNSTKRLLSNLFIPILAGGIFVFALAYHGIFYLIAPATLIFYGLGLLNAAKYTLHDIRYLGLLEILLGLVGTFFIGYGLLFWTIGFGLLHIIYGLVMYVKYER
ncbi:MAG: hypothetical protein J7L46_00340 [Bacteroidales bacterium]|nr:hypothetical protein [Bacteroidales bacterium]